MPFIAGNKVVGRDNRAPGSPAGRENMVAGTAYPMPFREAQYLGTSKSIATLTRSGAVATAACTGHGLSVGNIVRVAGADQPEYNGHQRVNSTADADTFTFTVYGTPDSGSGTMTAKKVHQETVGD